ncbi:MAG TPA: hypothetical protein VGG72_03440 [Bryobacteraceae bacterium]|jgi:hypothetical protein
MALKKPVPVGDIKPVREEALGLALDLARIRVNVELTKFRFKSGGLLLFLSVLIFLAGESIEVGKHFRPEFPDRAWFVAKMLFLVGLAFAGREIVEAVIGGWKSVFKGSEQSHGQ